VTIVEDTRVTRADTNVITASADAPPAARGITGGVDTHADTHVAAALDPLGGLLGVREFPATARPARADAPRERRLELLVCRSPGAHGNNQSTGVH
jgi:hypothetical protein